MRRGVITASRAKDLIAKGRTAGSVGEARRTYMMELIAEVVTRCYIMGDQRMTVRCLS